MVDKTYDMDDMLEIVATKMLDQLERRNSYEICREGIFYRHPDGDR